MWKSLVRICIGVGVILGGLWAFGIGSIFWKSYTIKRNPVYQTTMTDFEICDEFDENITQKFNDLGVNKVHCFIFQGHPQRPSYWIYIVGKCSENAKLPKTYSSHSLEEEITVFTALKLAGAAPDDSEILGEIAAWFYRYKNWVVFKMPGNNHRFYLKMPISKPIWKNISANGAKTNENYC